MSASECPRCGEIELRLEPSTENDAIHEYYCDNCPHWECRPNVDYDPTADEEGEPPITWKERANWEKPR
jgi:hypothetical protein